PCFSSTLLAVVITNHFMITPGKGREKWFSTVPARRTPCGACFGTATPLYSPAEGVHDAVSHRRPGTDHPTDEPSTGRRGTHRLFARHPLRPGIRFRRDLRGVRRRSDRKSVV